MLKLKRVVFLLVFLSAIALNIDFTVTDAQTKKGKPQANPAATATKKTPKLTPLPVRPGVDYSVFDHNSHSPDCLSCHIPDRVPTFTDKRIKQPDIAKKPFTYDDRVTQFPPHAACEECHSIVQFSFPVPATKGFCQICHEADKKTVLSVFPEQRDDQFGMRFPHDIHVGIKSKSYNVGPKVEELTDEQKQLQAVSISSGCSECHVKDGKDKDEEDFSIPYHPECARCHSEAPTDPTAKDNPKFKLKNEKPYMRECLECHKPFMAPRPVVSDIIVQTDPPPKFNPERINPDKPYKSTAIPFTHSYSSHEQDLLKEKVTKLGPDKKPVLDKNGKEVKAFPELKCQYCHEDAAKSKRVQGILIPSAVKSCIPCHNNGKGGLKSKGHELTLGEIINLRP